VGHYFLLLLNFSRISFSIVRNFLFFLCWLWGFAYAFYFSGVTFAAVFTHLSKSLFWYFYWK